MEIQPRIPSGELGSRAYLSKPDRQLFLLKHTLQYNPKYAIQATKVWYLEINS